MPPDRTGQGLFTVRPPWASVPASVRDRLADLVGSPTIGWTDLHGGMSPGPAARLTLADGRRVFVKGGSAIVSSRSHRLHVREAEVLGGLAPTVPAARLLAVVRATLVDWAFGGQGAPWLDRAWLATDIVAAGHVGGPARAVDEVMRLLATAPTEASRFVVAVAGMWRFNATLPPHPGMSTHRRWQFDRARALRPLLDVVRTTIR